MSLNTDHSDFDDDESKWDYFRKLKLLDHDEVDENDERLRKYIHSFDETQSSVLSDDELNAMERAIKLRSLRDKISDNIVQKIEDPKDRMLVALLYKVCNDIDPTRMQFIKFSILLYEHGILSNLRFLMDDNEDEEEEEILIDNEGWSDSWSEDDDDGINTETNTDSVPQIEDTSVVKKEAEEENGTIMSFKSFSPLINEMEEEKASTSNAVIPLNQSSSSCLSTIGIDSRYAREFEEIECVGYGAFGTVYRVRHHLDRAIYAMKKIVYKHDGHNYEEVKSKIVREVSNMAQLNHDNIVRYYSSWIEPLVITNNDYLAQKKMVTRWNADNIFNHWQNKMSYSCLFLQSEYCGDYTLKDFINSAHRTPDRDDNMHIFAQILLGLAHCHNKKIIHRDLKPENVFLMGSNHELFRAKIGDFGLSKSLMNKNDANNENAVGTQTYAAPEQLTGEIVGGSADIYAAGIILFELIQPAFDTQMERIRAISRFRKLHEIDTDRVDEVKCGKEIEIIMKMTAKNPRNRPSAYELILDQFIQIYWMKNVLNGAIPVSLSNELKSKQAQKSLPYLQQNENENDIRVSVVEKNQNEENISDSPTFLISSPSTPPISNDSNSPRNLHQVMSPLSIN